jgi:beta-glucosidase-like glycosyl hydrolase
MSSSPPIHRPAHAGRARNDIGAVILPEVRAAGAGTERAVVPPDLFLERFPPVGLVAFGRTPAGAVSPAPLLEAVRERCAALGAERPFAACDLEQGAGLHFPPEAGATRLPPALALAAAGERWVREAGERTAREARALGVELVLAPVCDVNTRGDNPIIAARAFGDDPAQVAVLAAAFLEGLHAGGAGGCAKHYPGHGDTDLDSHLELPFVARGERELLEIELAPFRSLAGRGVDAVMVAHLDVPALTGESGLATSLSPRAIATLRGELGFRGAVLSDALDMGALGGARSLHARALAAGCDGLLCPSDPLAAARELGEALERGDLARERLREAAGRMRALRSGLLARRAPPPTPDGAEWAVQAGVRALCRAGTWPWRAGAPCEVEAPFPPGQPDEVRALVARLRDSLVGTTGAAGVLLPVACEARAGAGRRGLSAAELADLRMRIASHHRLGWPAALAWFAPPQWLPRGWWERPEVPLLVAFAPSPPMFEALRRVLAGEARPGGSLPCAPG